MDEDDFRIARRRRRRQTRPDRADPVDQRRPALQIELGQRRRIGQLADRDEALVAYRDPRLRDPGQLERLVSERQGRRHEIGAGEAGGFQQQGLGQLFAGPMPEIA